jgi:radical SAM superfamily enzyme YgiQ (UPF0313 family)
MVFKNILLIKPSGRHGISFAYDIIPTGLEYIAANIEDIVDTVEIIDLEYEPKPIQRSIKKYLNQLKPDLVGISLSATEHSEGLKIAEVVKNHGVRTVLGGYHPTAIPNELLQNPNVDFVVRGEGEETMRELIKAGSAKGIAGISYKLGKKIIHNPDREFIKDLDSLPFPARHLRRYRYHLTIRRNREHDVLTTSRGCWGRCNFCCEPSMSGSKQRYRAPENVMAEILEIVKFHNGKPLSIEITDPHFMGKPRLVEQLCDLLAKHKLDIKFVAKVRPDSMAKFPEIVRKMIAVGIETYEMGIESSNMKDIKYTSKGLKTNVHVRAVKNITRWGGMAGGTFVIGLPDHTEEEILHFPKYAKKLGLLSSAYGIVTPYPGTKFYDDLAADSLIFETNWDRFDEMHSVFKTNNLSSSRIEELATICMAKFWTVDTFLERERVRLKVHGSKKELMTFIGDRMSDLQFGAGSGFQLQEGNFINHFQKLLEASPDPEVRNYTENVGIHNVLEMSRYLRMLGTQIIQITIRNNGTGSVSWILKTSKNKVEYVDVIHGKLKNSTINFNIDLNDLLINGRPHSSNFDGVKIALKILASNKGIKRRLNMFRFLLATGVELLTYKIRKKRLNNNGNKNYRPTIL